MLKNWNDVAISFTARISNHLGPVTRMIDTVIDRVVSVQTAQACNNSWPVCGAQCVYGYCGGTGDTIYIVTYGLNCSQQGVKCTYDYCGGC